MRGANPRRSWKDMRLEIDGLLPGGLPNAGRSDPCGCGSGKKFKKCCWARTIARASDTKRLLVLGAGATVEECRRSGADPDAPLPTIPNFGQRLFNESQSLQRVTAAYLDHHGISYDAAILKSYEGQAPSSISQSQFENGPLRVYQRLEAHNPSQHNVERLFEYVWQEHGADGDLWEALTWDGVFLYLFNEFITQFGCGPATAIRRMNAGIAVADRLFVGDRVLSLNYDIAFDLALQQAHKYFTYAPEERRDAIIVYKPHGSFNLFCNRKTGDCFFGNPSEPRGSVAIRDKRGGIWSPASAIVPPRLGKNYAQHPAAGMILDGLADFVPNVVTFWGVGLTDSDVDLLEIFRETSKKSSRVEFINPDVKAFERAGKLLGTSILHFPSLDDWLA